LLLTFALIARTALTCFQQVIFLFLHGNQAEEAEKTLRVMQEVHACFYYFNLLLKKQKHFYTPNQTFITNGKANPS
jgi:hypothetical protein